MIVGQNTTSSMGSAQISQDDLESSVALMAKIGACWSPSFSPDGRHLALISNLNGLPQAWIVSTNGGWPELVTALPDQIYEVSWSPDGAWLAFLLSPGGGMNRQIYLVRPDGSELKRLTQGGKENNWLGSWTHDSKKLIISSNQRSADAMDACFYDLESSQLKIIVKNQGIGFFSDISRDGKLATLNRMENRSDNNLYLVDLENRAETLLTPHDVPGSFDGGRFSPDGKTIYLSSNKDQDLIAFCKIGIDQEGNPGDIEVLIKRDDAELQEFDIAKDAKTAVLLWNKAGLNEIEFVDLETSEIIPGPRLPTEIANTPTFSQNGNLVTMVLSGSTAPMDIYVYDRNHDYLWQVTKSQHAGVVLEGLTRPSLERFPAHDGIQLSGWLYQPVGFKVPGPIVLSFHGGPEGQEQPTFKGHFQALLSQGIAVFAPNVRGSAGFGKRFVNLDNGPLRFDAIRDIETCLDYVVSLGIADPSKVGIMGGSYGGYMTMVGLTEFPDRFAAGANYFGIVNFETFFEHTEPWMAEISKIQYGDPETQTDLLRELSPIHKLDRVTGATIVLHGANDTNVPVIEAEQVVQNLEQRGIPVKYILFPDEGHGFSKEPNRIRANVETVRWFCEHLNI
jgi:dipeptidyl aminopeptidase/acylaminoacyl peptidase